MFICNLIERHQAIPSDKSEYKIVIETKRYAWRVIIAVDTAVHQLHRKRRLHFVIEYVDATDTLLHNDIIDLQSRWIFVDGKRDSRFSA